MMDVLAGVLTGSAFFGGVAEPYDPTRRSGAGLLVILSSPPWANRPRSPRVSRGSSTGRRAARSPPGLTRSSSPASSRTSAESGWP